jgi:hypothetical protein
VTFQPEQPETFLLRKGRALIPCSAGFFACTLTWEGGRMAGVWNMGSYEVQDVAGNPWFRLEGRDSQWTGQKKLLLNTGIHHATVERSGGAYWHVYVANERRVTVRMEEEGEALSFFVFLHEAPYPTRTSPEADGSAPALVARGNCADHSYAFAEHGAARRVIARVDRAAVGRLAPGTADAADKYVVAIGAWVDVALVLTAAVVIDSAVQEGGRESLGPHTGRSSMGDSARSGRWSTSLDTVPIQMPPQPNAGARPVGAGSKVPPLWGKGRTPRNGVPV